MDTAPEEQVDFLGELKKYVREEVRIDCSRNGNSEDVVGMLMAVHPYGVYVRTVDEKTRYLIFDDPNVIIREICVLHEGRFSTVYRRTVLCGD